MDLQCSLYSSLHVVTEQSLTNRILRKEEPRVEGIFFTVGAYMYMYMYAEQINTDGCTMYIAHIVYLHIVCGTKPHKQ